MVSEYIERDDAKKTMARFLGYGAIDEDMVCRFGIALDNIPAADVRPVVRGFLTETREPIEGHPTWYRKHLCCSECGVQIRLESWNEVRCFGAGTILRENEMPKYCPNCGADMREVDHGND